MSLVELKHKLDDVAFDKLRAIVKRKTSIQNMDETNIKTIKEAVTILTSWLEEVYALDSQVINMDDDGLDIEKLFKSQDSN